MRICYRYYIPPDPSSFHIFKNDHFTLKHICMYLSLYRDFLKRKQINIVNWLSIKRCNICLKHKLLMFNSLLYLTHWILDRLYLTIISMENYLNMQSAKLNGSPKPDACKIVHGRIKWVVPRACEKKSNKISKVDFIKYCV